MRPARAQLAAIMLPFVMSLLVVLAIVALIRRPGVFSPALVMETASSWPGTPAPTDDDEQLPETDRAPRNWLPWTVAAVGAVRVAALLALHA